MGVWIANLIIYGWLAVRLRPTKKYGQGDLWVRTQDQRAKYLMRKLALFPIASIAVWTFPLTNR